MKKHPVRKPLFEEFLSQIPTNDQLNALSCKIRHGDSLSEGDEKALEHAARAFSVFWNVFTKTPEQKKAFLPIVAGMLDGMRVARSTYTAHATSLPDSAEEVQHNARDPD